MDEREFTVEFTGYSNVDFTFDVTVKAFNGYEALRQATNNPRFFGFPLLHVVDSGSEDQVVINPYGCQHCGRDQRNHGMTYTQGRGLHYFVIPDNNTIKSRMKLRAKAK